MREAQFFLNSLFCSPISVHGEVYPNRALVHFSLPLRFGVFEWTGNGCWLCFQVKGTVFATDNSGAYVDITAKSTAYLPLHEACIHRIKNVEEAGIIPGVREEFMIIDENQADDTLILSLRSIQYDIAWERCRQLKAEDAVVKGKVGFANSET